MGRSPDLTAHQRTIEMANKHVKHAHSTHRQEMQIKTIIQWPKSKTLTTPNAYKGCGTTGAHFW